MESYWDKAKQQPRQKRRYLGKENPLTGQAETPRKSLLPKQSRDVGHLYVLSKLAERTGLIPCLEQVFGEYTQFLLSLVYYQLIESKPWHLYEVWREGCDLSYTLPLTSQKISELFKLIGERDGWIHAFFRAWAHHHGTLEGAWLDITSISSYATQNEWVEWGYNRDQEPLPKSI